MRRLLCGLAALSASVAGVSAAEELAEVKELMRGGRYERALVRLEGRLAVEPGDPEARFLKGLVLVEQERPDEALETFRALTVDYPALPEPHNNLAVLYAAKGDYDKARESLLMAIETHPSYATAHENLGDIYARMASHAYGQALQINVDNDVARVKLEMIRELFSSRDSGARATRSDGRAAAAPAASEPATEAAESLPASELATAALPTERVAAAPASEVAAARPAVAAPAPDPGPLSGSEWQVRETLARWARAWSSQDVDAYLEHYARDFEPEDGLPRGRWERQRRIRLGDPEFIEVRLSNVEIELGPTGEARVTFTQDYRSDVYSDRVRKAMRLSESGSEWKILSERSRP